MLSINDLITSKDIAIPNIKNGTPQINIKIKLINLLLFAFIKSLQRKITIKNIKAIANIVIIFSIPYDVIYGLLIVPTIAPTTNKITETTIEITLYLIFLKNILSSYFSDNFLLILFFNLCNISYKDGVYPSFSLLPIDLYTSLSNSDNSSLYSSGFLLYVFSTVITEFFSLPLSNFKKPFVAKLIKVASSIRFVFPIVSTYLTSPTFIPSGG